MMDLFDRVAELDLYTVAATCIIIFVGTPMFVEGLKKWKNMFGKTNKTEEKQDDIDTKIDELDHKIDDKVDKVSHDLIDKQELYHNQSIEIREKLKTGQDDLKDDVNSLREELKELRQMLQEYIKTDNEKTIATLRTSLWRMHKIFVEQDYVTPDALKTFMEEGKVYEKAGGNDIYHEKLLPEVLALDIHYPDGSIYKQSDRH